MAWLQGDASWSLGPQAACSGSLAAGLQIGASMPCLQEISMFLVVQGRCSCRCANRSGKTVFACWGAAPVLLDVFSM